MALMEALGAGLILFVAALIHGLCGFAFALIAVPLLSLFCPLRIVVPLMALLGFALNAVLFIFLRKHFLGKPLLPLLLGALPGVLVGAKFLSHAPEGALKALLGIILVGYGLWGLINPQPGFVLTDRWGYLFGFGAGLLGAALNTPGPPVVIYFTLKGWSKDQVKSTLQGYFLLLLFLVIGAHLYSGLLTGIVFQKFLFFLPMVLIGLALGHYLYQFVYLRVYVRLLYILLIVAGVLNFLDLRS